MLSFAKLKPFIRCLEISFRKLRLDFPRISNWIWRENFLSVILLFFCFALQIIAFRNIKNGFTSPRSCSNFWVFLETQIFAHRLFFRSFFSLSHKLGVNFLLPISHPISFISFSLNEQIYLFIYHFAWLIVNSSLLYLMRTNSSRVWVWLVSSPAACL